MNTDHLIKPQNFRVRRDFGHVPKFTHNEELERETCIPGLLTVRHRRAGGRRECWVGVWELSLPGISELKKIH